MKLTDPYVVRTTDTRTSITWENDSGDYSLTLTRYEHGDSREGPMAPSVRYSVSKMEGPQNYRGPESNTITGGDADYLRKLARFINLALKEIDA